MRLFEIITFFVYAQIPIRGASVVPKLVENFFDAQCQLQSIDLQISLKDQQLSYSSAEDAFCTEVQMLYL